MGRIKKSVLVAGASFWALFDTGSVHTYVIPQVADRGTSIPLTKSHLVSLGGKKHEITHDLTLHATIEKYLIYTHSFVIDSIGKDEKGKDIDILFGALMMQQWGIRPLPKEETLDFTYYPEVFVEFLSQLTL